jgi:hypothetical protein
VPARRGIRLRVMLMLMTRRRNVLRVRGRRVPRVRGAAVFAARLKRPAEFFRLFGRRR